MQVLQNSNLKVMSEQEKQSIRNRLSRVNSKDEEEKLRELLALNNIRLVFHVAKRFKNLAIEYEDLISVGILGLIKAAKTFNTKKNNKFATYASICIRNEILMKARKVKGKYKDISLQEPVDHDFDGNKLSLEDLLGTGEELVYEEIEHNFNKEKMREILSKLPKRDRLVVILRNGLANLEPMTQQEVAKALGYTQSYISRLEVKIVDKLRLLARL